MKRLTEGVYQTNDDLTVSNSSCCIATYIYRYMRNIINHNDDFNERTNTLLYKNISPTLYSRKGDVSCV